MDKFNSTIWVKVNLLILTFGMLTSFLKSQDLCSPGTNSKAMKVGSYTIHHKVSGDFISNINEPGISLQSEDGDAPISILNSLSLWISGVDDGNNPKIATNQNNGKHDWFPGPLSQDGLTQEENCRNFNQIWEVTAQELKDFKCDYSNNFVIDDEHPAIYGWPAVGNKFFEEIHGFKLPDDNNGLAPFWDYGENGVPDGRYDPDKGDFPGELFFSSNRMENMQFWIINDNGNLHSNSESDPIKMEAQILAFTASLCESLDSRMFYKIKLVNRASEPINDCSIGFLGDVAIGCPENDMVGVDPHWNLSYAYNKSGQDSLDCTCYEPNPNCNNNYLFGCHLLRGPLNENFEQQGFESFLPIVKDSTFPYQHQMPNNPQEYLNVMAGKWTDGSDIYQGELGLNSSFPVTKFAFDSPPEDEEGWSMCQEDFPKSDKYFLSNVGRFRLDPGVKNEFIFGLYFYNSSDPIECPSIEPLIQMASESEIDQFNGCSGTTTSTNLMPCPPYIEPLEVNVYPNPSNGTFNIKTSRGHTFKLILRNIFGSIIYEEDDILVQKEFSSELQGTFILEIISDSGERTIQKIQFL